MPNGLSLMSLMMLAGGRRVDGLCSGLLLLTLLFH
jgi:hypothetical protein